jgi:hypothetical protein
MNMTLVHLCTVERSMWCFLVGYLYGHKPLLYVRLPHLLYILREEKSMYLCNCLGGSKKLGFVMSTLGECMKKREMS